MAVEWYAPMCLYKCIIALTCYFQNNWTRLTVVSVRPSPSVLWSIPETTTRSRCKTPSWLASLTRMRAITWIRTLRKRHPSQSLCKKVRSFYDDVIKWKHFPRYWPFVGEIHQSTVNSPHKGQWRGAVMFSLICAWINGWVNNREAGDLRHHRAHYDVTVMFYVTEAFQIIGNSTAV